jgi:hypothetical protein
MPNAEGEAKTLSKGGVGKKPEAGRAAGGGVTVVESGHERDVCVVLPVPAESWGQVRGGGVWNQGI